MVLAESGCFINGNDSSMLAQSLPEYTTKLFTEKGLNFLADTESELEFLALRPGQAPFDIRYMSGGEKRRLTLAFIFTLAKLVIQDKRSNILILDEISSNLDSLGTYLFVEEVLPLLKQQYESIFLISHDIEVPISSKEGSLYNSIWTVYKENNNCKLSIT